MRPRQARISGKDSQPLCRPKLADPHFEAQTKVRLTNPEVGSFVETVVNEQLGHYIEEHPAEAKRILSKAIQAAAAREAARKAASLPDVKVALGSSSLPGKLWDCANRERTGTNYSSSKATPRAVPQRGQGQEHPGDIATEGQNPQRREGPARKSPRARGNPHADKRAGHGNWSRRVRYRKVPV